MKICPVCNHKYSNYPAISRVDNKTEICPDCGLREALEDFFVSRNCSIKSIDKESEYNEM